MIKKKRHTFRFEESLPLHSLLKIDEELHSIMKHPLFEFKFGLPELKFSHEFMHATPVAIADAGNELIIRAWLPGFEKKDINLRVGPSAATISAQKKQEKREITEKHFKQERAFGSAQRSFSLPVEVMPETAQAKFEHGVMEITVKKAKGAAKKEKEVKLT